MRLAAALEIHTAANLMINAGRERRQEPGGPAGGQQNAHRDS
ncbi:hypothetical protein [Micromonospora sp. URMC 107]